MSGPPLDIVRSSLERLTAYVPPPPPAVKLDANESPWPLPPPAQKRIAEAIAALPLHRYPDVRSGALRAALSARTGGAPESFVIGCGSDEVIALLTLALSRPRPGLDRAAILLPVPTFVMFAVNARVHGLDAIEVPLGDGFALDTEAMLRAVAEQRPNIVFLATPNNPTGNAFDDDALAAIVKAAKGALVVLDEAYAAFAGRTLGDWCDRHDNVAVLGTLSKVGLAAARVGWARLHPALAAEVDKVRQPYNLNRISETVATLALTELAPVLDAQIADIVRERDALGAALAAVPGLTVCPSRANFFLVRVEGDAHAFAARLAARGVGVRAFGDPLLAGCVRITVGTPEENAQLLRALDDAR